MKRFIQLLIKLSPIILPIIQRELNKRNQQNQQYKK